MSMLSIAAASITLDNANVTPLAFTNTTCVDGRTAQLLGARTTTGHQHQETPVLL
jgi:hypothetical protein